MVLVVENNKWAYSTPTSKQTANPRFVDRADAYGCFGAEVDGNDVLAVYETTRQAVARARNGLGPTLIEADTMRMRGHAEHDDMKYVPRRDARGLGQARSHRSGTRSTSSERAASPPRSSHVPAPRRMLSISQELALAEASPLPASGAGLSDVYADRPVRPPVPPLVREWEAGPKR